jgi:hypothetical protein
MGEITLLERSYTATALREGEDRPEREWDVAAEVEEIRQLERVFVEAAVSAATRAARAARAANATDAGVGGGGGGGGNGGSGGGGGNSGSLFGLASKEADGPGREAPYSAA